MYEEVLSLAVLYQVGTTVCASQVPVSGNMVRTRSQAASAQRLAERAFLSAGGTKRKLSRRKLPPLKRSPKSLQRKQPHQERQHQPRNFWRTLATARPSTGGPGIDPAESKRRAEAWAARQRALGVVNGRSYGHWKDGRIGRTWVFVDPKTEQPLS